jgi:hypothetical protein
MTRDLRHGVERRDLYHSALEVQLGADRFVIEMTPAWGQRAPERGVVGTGSVGLSWLGHSRFFRYEVRRWRNGRIPDVAEAVASPRRLSLDAWHAQRVLELVPEFATATWGRDELRTGEMWNSNSLTAWLLACSGHDMDAIAPPPHGRAPGWAAGMVAAARSAGVEGGRRSSPGPLSDDPGPSALVAAAPDRQIGHRRVLPVGEPERGRVTG